MKKIGAFLIAAALALVCVPADAKSVLLSHSFKAGQIDNYKMTMDMRLSSASMPTLAGKPVTMKMSMTFRQKVLGILPDGSARVSLTYNQIKVSCPGFPQVKTQAMPPQTVTMTLAPDGSLIAIDGMSRMMANLPGLDFSQLAGQMGYYGVFPSEPVEVGQSWTKDIPLPFNSGALQVVSTLLNAAVPIGKQTVCKIKQDYQAYLDIGALMNAVAADQRANIGDFKFSGGMEMKGWTVIYFSPSAGRFVKANGKAKAGMSFEMPPQLVSQGAPQSISMDVDMTINIARV